MNTVIFDDRLWCNFKPLSYTRSVGDIRVGILKLRQRIVSYMNSDSTAIIIPSILEKLYRERHPEWSVNVCPVEECYYVNSRIKITDVIMKEIEQLQSGDVIMSHGIVVAFRYQGDGKHASTESIDSIAALCKNEKEINADFWTHNWDFISENKEWIKKDFDEFFYEKDNLFETEMGVTVLNPYQVWIGEGVEIKPGVVIDASEGPVVIDENAMIMANAVIIGPTYIGKGSIIKVAAKIYEGSTIGPMCKIGGEIEDSIIHGYSNKQHDGFLGHSYLGEWVNIGADTNNSDLKNNYGHVKMYSYPEGNKINTGLQFLGCVLGDHTKLGINCSINTGCVTGTACNLYGKDLISDYIPDFSWGEGKDLVIHKVEKFIETAKLVKMRRKMLFTKTEENIFKSVYEEIHGMR
ncbi:MAG TPA: putative sugar nucleotidyl transferase [Candidatus Cloacimonadota bacterium]|nr:putative sugar nucleotidyl transferase [Candidatus Cloacimonadota bacterium]HPT71097.1 putative sugar nucleotidyl transferase [Candidatus Cloacimonadota bacterium]